MIILYNCCIFICSFGELQDSLVESQSQTGLVEFPFKVLGSYTTEHWREALLMG